MGNGTARLAPERRALLRRIVARRGIYGTARALRVGVATLERAADPYALLPEATVQRLDAALGQLSL